MFRAQSGQKWRVIAFNVNTGLPVTGIAATITAELAIDGDYNNKQPTTDVNPTEIGDGYYYFDLSRAETNGYLLELFCVSSVPSVVVLGGYRTTIVPPAVPSGGQNISPTTVLFGYGPSGTDMDFFCYNDAREVWNGSAFVIWNAADFVSYRVAATEIENSGQYTATPPTGTITYELRDRSAALATSEVRWFWVPTSVAYGFGESGDNYDFYVFKNNQVWDGTAFVDWDDADYLDYRIAATELTGSGRFYPSSDIPLTADRYDMRVRGASLLLSLVVFDADYSYAAPSTRTGYLYCYDEDGVVETGVIVTLRCYYAPGTGLALDSAIRSGTSDVNGRVTFSNLVIGAKYKVRRGQQPEFSITIPDGVTDFALTSIVGRE